MDKSYAHSIIVSICLHIPLGALSNKHCGQGSYTFLQAQHRCSCGPRSSKDGGCKHYVCVADESVCTGPAKQYVSC